MIGKCQRHKIPEIAFHAAALQKNWTFLGHGKERTTPNYKKGGIDSWTHGLKHRPLKQELGTLSPGLQPVISTQDRIQGRKPWSKMPTLSPREFKPGPFPTPILFLICKRKEVSLALLILQSGCQDQKRNCFVMGAASLCNKVLRAYSRLQYHLCKYG